MPENEDGQDKSEDPTAKKKSEARKKGQVTRSQELTTLFMLLASIIGIMFFSEDIIQAITDIMKNSFSVERNTLFDSDQLFIHFKAELKAMLFALIPFFIVMFITAILSNAMLGGFNFSAEAMAPKFSKINPLKGIKKVFGTKGLIELVKSISK